MKFGVFIDLDTAGRGEQGQRNPLLDILDQMELADRLGYESAWVVEHQPSKGFPSSLAPDMIFAAASQRTKRLRLGHGVNLLPLLHPLRVAERLAILDVISNGRVDFGTGGGASPLEYGTFGVPMQHSQRIWEESLAVIMKAWEGATFNYEGQFYRFSNTAVHPKPVQAPHPPTWVASMTPQGWDFVAKKGFNLLGVSMVKTLDQLAVDISTFRKALAANGHDPSKARVGVVTPVHVAESSAKAREVAEEALIWHFRRQARLINSYAESDQEGYEYYVSELESVSPKRWYSTLQEAGMIIVGDPAECLAQVRRFHRAGVTDILAQFQVGSLTPQTAQRSMDLFARHVVPSLQKQAAGV